MDNEQLVARIRAGEHTADNMLLLWEQNQKFIRMMAAKYGKPADQEDLEHEGYIGLCHAVDHYNSDTGVPFINYAAFWIRNAMNKYVCDCCGAVRIPYNTTMLIRRYKRTVSDYERMVGCEPSERALCDLLEVSREKLHTIQNNAKIGTVQSLSAPVGGEDEEITLEGTLASDEDLAGDVTQRIDHQSMEQELWDAVDRLPGDQPAVIRSRYVHQKTRGQICEAMSLPAVSAARTIEEQALKTLRLKKNNGGYVGYYEEYIRASGYRHVGVAAFKRTWMSEVEREALR